MKNNKFFIYYTVLVLLLVFYQSFNEPPLILRLAFIAAIVIPTFLSKEISYPAVLTMFITIGNYSFAYNYMPNQIEQYLLITLIAAPILLSIRKNIKKKSVPIVLAIFPFYILMVDVITTGLDSDGTMFRYAFYCFSLLLLFLLIIGDDIDATVEQIPLCLWAAA